MVDTDWIERNYVRIGLSSSAFLARSFAYSGEFQCYYGRVNVTTVIGNKFAICHDDGHSWITLDDRQYVISPEIVPNIVAKTSDFLGVNIPLYVPDDRVKSILGLNPMFMDLRGVPLAMRKRVADIDFSAFEPMIFMRNGQILMMNDSRCVLFNDEKAIKNRQNGWCTYIFGRSCHYIAVSQYGVSCSADEDLYAEFKYGVDYAKLTYDELYQRIQLAKIDFFRDTNDGC